MIVSFKFYVMNFVDFMFDFYSHITSHVSQVFASYTHYTSYSLPNFVHVIVCVFGLTNQVWKFPWVLCKSYLMLENLREWIENLKFWENWVQNLCFRKTFHLILMHFILKIQCFEEFLHKIGFFFFKNLFFPEFWSIEPVFQSIEIA